VIDCYVKRRVKQFIAEIDVDNIAVFKHRNAFEGVVMATAVIVTVDDEHKVVSLWFGATAATSATRLSELTQT
jgi:hypothetical protein